MPGRDRTPGHLANGNGFALIDPLGDLAEHVVARELGPADSRT